ISAPHFSSSLRHLLSDKLHHHKQRCAGCSLRRCLPIQRRDFAGRSRARQSNTSPRDRIPEPTCRHRSSSPTLRRTPRQRNNARGSSDRQRWLRSARKSARARSAAASILQKSQTTSAPAAFVLHLWLIVVAALPSLSFLIFAMETPTTENTETVGPRRRRLAANSQCHSLFEPLQKRR